MEYKLVNGNSEVAGYGTCTNALREGGVSVPAEVRAGQDEAATQRMVAFQETDGLVNAAPSVPWEDDSRNAVRDVLESRYM